MRSITKDDAPECLSEYENSTNWREITTACKDNVASKCFDEQNGLCIYCERQLEYPDWQKNSHCEHLVPRHTKSRVFDFSNIALSCNGTPPVASLELEAYDNKANLSCGHSRDDKAWDSNLFLHPTDLGDLENYFDWDLPTAKITTTGLNSDRADHMILLLNLNNGYLRGARQKARGAFRKIFDNPKYSDDTFIALQDSQFAFSSFLKATFDV